MMFVVVCCFALLGIVAAGHGDMSRSDKQKLLDLNNYYRAEAPAANIRRLEWSVELEEDAHKIVESCLLMSPLVEVRTFHEANLDGDITDKAVKHWRINDESGQKILWAETRSVGCAMNQCPQVADENENKLMNVTLVACKYFPTYFDDQNELPYKEGECDIGMCPSDLNKCAQYNGENVPQGETMDRSHLYCCPDDTTNPTVPEEKIEADVIRRIFSVYPRTGSKGGQTKIVVFGEGFNPDQFDHGNTVILRSGDTTVKCDIIGIFISAKHIICNTREAEDLTKDTSALVDVDVHSVGYIVACSDCSFSYTESATPYVYSLSELATSTRKDFFLNISGKLFASDFKDPDDPKDSTSTDKDNSANDVFIRIDLGFQCIYLHPNGTQYPHSIDEDGKRASIICKFIFDDLISSLNLSVMTERNGKALLSYSLSGVDNNLKAYNFQTHADILAVTPQQLSIGGGTRITITLSHSLKGEYELEVRVGGAPCEVTSVQNEGDQNTTVIECVTPSRPPNTIYYPGGRGVRREVFKDMTYLDNIKEMPRSMYYEVHERLFISSDEEYVSMGRFSHRYSGFFVPPKSSLYTFNLRSDDRSRLYLSPNMSKDYLTQIIDVPHWTRRSWNAYKFQMSKPVFMEQGKSYYFEALGNEYGVNWDLGLGVKLHNSTILNGPDSADREQQEIAIMSSVAREEHMVVLKAHPKVQRISLQPVITGESATSVGITCTNMTLTITRGNNFQANVTISPFSSAKELEHVLNEAIAANDIRISLSKMGYSGTAEAFWSSGSNSTIQLTLVYLTSYDVDADMIPSIAVSSEPSCNANDSAGLQLTVNITTVQNLHYPRMFDAGFDNRFTAQLPLNATAEALQLELTGLLASGCTEDYQLNQKTVRYEKFETPQDSVTEDNFTSFCGLYSSRNPRTVSRVDYKLSDVPYICFAYKGSLPLLRVRLTYTRQIVTGATYVEDKKLFSTETMSSACDDWPFHEYDKDSDGWTKYGCVNVMECVNKKHPNTEDADADTQTIFKDHMVYKVYFHYNPNFYIDNLAFAKSKIEVFQVDAKRPVTPNRVIINYFEVIKVDTLSQAPVTTYSGETDEGTSEEFLMEVAKFRVIYGVKQCGFGMSLLKGRYDGSNETGVQVSQVNEASKPVSGNYSITIGDTSQIVHANATASDLKHLMNIAFCKEGAFDVIRSRTCAGYSWTVSWLNARGDLSLMIVDGSNLIGSETNINVIAVVNGGLWIRPLRADMLRLPEEQPQVEVIINKIPSSCFRQNCNLSYEAGSTPEISSIFPTEGQMGTDVIISGSKFSLNSEGVTVTIGKSVCDISFINESVIKCAVGLHSAGCYAVGVYIEGVGNATTEASACFKYLLMVDSVSPSVGGVSGGHMLTLFGKGFSEFVNGGIQEEGPLSYLPWFRYGVGVFKEEQMNHYCPSFSEKLRDFYKKVISFSNFPLSLGDDFCIATLENHIRAIYSNSSLEVLVGGSPCIILQATVSNVSCIPMTGIAGPAVIVVSVFDQTVTLNNSYSISINNTVKVQNVSPSSGSVVGNDTVIATGMVFGSDSGENGVQVMVGGRACGIKSFSNNEIRFTTASHHVGTVLVFISVPSGIAILQSASDTTDNAMASSMFPTYTYELKITNASVLEGSMLGCTIVTLTGEGFVLGETKVFVGWKQAKVYSVNHNEVVFRTPQSSRVHSASLLNRLDAKDDESSTIIFTLNKTDFMIAVGDSINCSWRVGFKAQMLKVELYEIQSNDSSHISKKENGFSQSADGLSNSINITFNESGTFHFAVKISHSGNPIGDILIGMVIVTELVPFTTHVMVFVRNFEARYELSSSNYQNQTGGCEANYTLPSPSETNRLSFSYLVSNTPTVTSINPKVADVTQVFTISGERFSSIHESNIVTLGGFPCVVKSSTTQTITFTISIESSPVLTSLLVSVLNSERGFGCAQVSNPTDATVVLHPHVSGISPSEGSLAGGTDIIISGYGFDCGNLETRIHGALCIIKSIQFNKIECTTSPHPVNVSNLELYCKNKELEYNCETNSPSNCTFSYSEERTPTVEQVHPATINSSGNHTIELIGRRFSNITDQNRVTLGDVPCSIISANSTNIMCVVSSLPAGRYPLGIKICNLTANGSRCFGNARFEDGVGNVTVNAYVVEVSPEKGSVNGGTLLTLAGFSFRGEQSSTSVTIGETTCKVQSATTEQIVCITSSHDSGKVPIAVRDGEVNIAGEVTLEFTITATPTVTFIDPSMGIGGDLVTITGTMFGGSVTVKIGEKLCTVISVNDTSLTCRLASNFAKTYKVMLRSTSLGNAESNVFFTYLFVVTSISSKSGSMAGQNTLMIQGEGFYPSNTTITICNRICSPTATPRSITTIECTVPSFSDTFTTQPDKAELSCSVNVTSLGMTATYNESYVYKRSLTPQVDSTDVTRGGTEGGTEISINGAGFTGTANVTIGGIPCDVKFQTETAITCTTRRSGVSLQDFVMVKIEEKGFAITESKFRFVDVWSSHFTWGGGDLPKKGDFVVIDKGQTLLLDTITPVLAYILIKGGKLIFDDEKEDNEVQLHTEGGLIIDGGSLEVGTEDQPFCHKTQIVLYGNVLSTEIPVYGAKTLALRKGAIHMHGKPINVTWTRLAKTAPEDATEIHLQDIVPWKVGDKIVLASTSYSQEENEEMEIAGIWTGSEGSILNLTTPLKYEHISIEQTIAGRKLETRGEVGLLTRNILVRGNKNQEWEQEVLECPKDFRPGQFERQTCFNGRFGKEFVGDHFGSQIMIHAAKLNQGDVIAQFEYIEVTHAGQAFKLGRYPIHFHLNGNVSGSYVRGCSIHKSFNRAITMHGVDGLLVERNVAFNIMGHAYFLEDGNEQFNIIQDNLGIFVRSSSSLLNVDITPATFWMVNANNYVRRNAAAGGTHFGFWYRLPEHPTGPSFDESFCPRKQQVLQFEDNTAHSFGWYGLWVFRQYHPSPTGKCNDDGHGTSQFKRFFAWRNDKGVEFTEIGSLQLLDSVMLDNKLAGVEVTEVESVWDEEYGPLISNTLIVGYSQLSEEGFCTVSGIKTPKSFYLIVSGVTFANFNRNNCWPITACSHCKHDQGGFETRYKNITFVNPGAELTVWQWEHEHIHRDLDGSLTGTGVPKLLIPTNSLLNQENCSKHNGSENAEGKNGSICDGGLAFGRIALFNPRPSSLRFASLNISNSYGEVVLPFVFKRLRGTGPAYMAQLELNQTYTLTWPNADTFTNISYTTLISGFSLANHIILRYTYPKPLDNIEIAGIKEAKNESTFNNLETARTGDHYVERDNVTLRYIIKGENFPHNERKHFFMTEKCYYDRCILPPPPTLPPPIPTGRPDDAVMWSNTSIWPNNTLPTAWQDVIINTGIYIVADVKTPIFNILIIKGGLEMDNDQNRTLEAVTIIIDGGRLVAGYPDVPFKHEFRIILHGNKTSPLYRHGVDKIRVDAKGIGVFGELILHAKTASNSQSWTLLGNTASKGVSNITLKEAMDWELNDKIIITSTSFDAYQTEVFEITNINGKVVSLNGTLKFTHLGVDELVGSVSYSIRAEVGHLTHKIVIENAEPERADMEQYGCRVLVASSGVLRSKVQLQGVEFKGCGQIGLSESYDPRFALALVNLGGFTGSYVHNCSFHDGYNTAIGMFGTNNVSFISNVIHGTVGPSMLVTGSSHTVVKNLASLSQFIGTYRGRNERSNSLWTANFMIVGTSEITFTGNHAAGGGKAGIHTDGEDCMNSASVITHNVAHSSLHCYHIGYSDGSKTGCSRFANITAYACHHYGFFMYSHAGVQLFDSTFINNKAAVFVSVIGPHVRSHKLGKETVQIERINVISASATFNCSQDGIVPEIAKHFLSHSPGLRTLSDGHVGIFIPSFLSGPGAFPKFIWASNHNYPAIAGVTTMKQVSFVNFGTRCGTKTDAAIMTNSQSEDANHPVDLEMILFENDVTSSNINKSKLFVHKPDINRVNPSDCVDMDCDGYKAVLLRDLDGSFTGAGSFRTVVSMAEFEWDGARERGIGDYRIPTVMLSRADGSPNNASVIYPQKGIIRANTFNGDSQCEFNNDWNMYICYDLEHLMLVLESLDEDTEVRRLSPIGIGANGYINLLNGPMDNGWCGGYTCQERISTYYAIVGSTFNYTIGLTSTNPRNFALHLLNAKDDQGIVVRIVYLAPQRLDVSVEENDGKFMYVAPKNTIAKANGGLQYLSDQPEEDYYPVLNDKKGANYFNPALKQLHVNIKGRDSYMIIIAQVILLNLKILVKTEDFFNVDTIVRNLAFLLNIPDDKIRIVNVTRETQPAKRRRRQTDGGGSTTSITLEIGDPPISTETSANNTNSTTASPTLSFMKLKELTEVVAAVVQTGEILNGTNATVASAEIYEPVAAPVDPTGGVLATPETGGPQPEYVDPNTPTFYDQQLISESEQANKSSAVQLSIPSTLVLTRGLTGNVVEGLPISQEVAPVFTMLDNKGTVSENLGVVMPWTLTATIISGPQGSFLTDHTVPFVKGRASFEGAVFSHPGSYSLTLTVSFPTSANFSIAIEPIVVTGRSISLEIDQQPQDGNITSELYPYPVVKLIDETTKHTDLQEHTWRNTTWYAAASLEKGKQEWTTELKRGKAIFTDITITNPAEYKIIFRAFTVPPSADLLPENVRSKSFEITTPSISQFTITYGSADFDSIVNGNTEAFIKVFEKKLVTQYPGVETFNTTISNGSIIVSTFITSRSTDRLVEVIRLLLTEGNVTLALEFGGQILTPSSIVQGYTYLVYPDDNLVLILATAIPAGAILCSCLLILVVCLCWRRREAKKKLNLQVGHVPNTLSNVCSQGIQEQENGVIHVSNNLYDICYPQGIEGRENVAEVFLRSQNAAADDISLRESQRKTVVTSIEAISVPGSFFTNPTVLNNDLERPENIYM